MRKVLNYVVVVLGASIIFAGCSTKEESISESSNQMKQEHTSGIYTDQEFVGAPSWILNPTLDGYIAEVGSAKRNRAGDIAFQRAEAMANARDNLARQIAVNVDAMFKSFKASTGSGENEAFDKASESVSKQIASQVLKNSVAKEIWVSKSGTMYIFMIINTKVVAINAESALNNSFKNEEALYQKFLAAKAQDELEKELEKRR